MPEPRFSTDAGALIKPAWVVSSSASPTVALDALTAALIEAKYRVTDADGLTRRLKAGSALRFLASNVLGVELIPGMRAWGFEARVNLDAAVTDDHTRIVVMLDRLTHGVAVALPYTARALDAGVADLEARGHTVMVGPLLEGKTLHRTS